MLAMEFLKTHGPSDKKPIYAVFGEDSYLRRESILTVIRAILGDEADDFSVSRFPGESASLPDVLDEVRTLPFLAKARVVIVENADPFVTANRSGLEGYAEHLSKTGVLVLSVKSWPSNTKLAKVVEKVGLSIDCKTPSARELPKWLIGLAKTSSSVTLESSAAELLVSLLGPDVGALTMEVEKLAVYVGQKRKIAEDDVLKMVGAGRVQKIWEAITAATTGHGDKALAGLDILFSANESPHEMMGAIRSSLLKTYHAGMLRKAKMEPREACKEAGLFYPAAIESTIKQHAHLGPSRVERLPEMLLKAEMDIKGASQLPPRTVIERLFAEFASPRQD